LEQDQACKNRHESLNNGSRHIHEKIKDVFANIGFN
jgi:hypothetical protein